MLPFLASVGGFVRSVLFRLDSQTVSNIGVSPGSATASISFGTDGVVRVNGSPTYSFVDGDSAANCTIAASATAGGFTSSAGAGDLAVTSTRTWNVVRNTVGTKSVTADFTLKNSGTTVATASITLSAEVVS